jgi:hypothetical protein
MTKHTSKRSVRRAIARAAKHGITECVRRVAQEEMDKFETDCDGVRSMFGEECIRELRSQRAGHPYLEEYISEAEYQDGVEYWDQYDTVNDVLEDFDLYRKVLEEDS